MINKWNLSNTSRLCTARELIRVIIQIIIKSIESSITCMANAEY